MLFGLKSGQPLNLTFEAVPAIAIAIREQLYEIAIQSVASARESRANKKGRRGTEHLSARKKRDWDVYEPIVDLLSNEEVDALEAREERIAR
ncbi:Chromatin structure-remodeling complex protein BSH [Capsicum annuum]|nr:Chromatin structure-remodeling complex protein BSH [Capsicum annuum]KAF3650253.1 Chromatin structure-remodeling complex protein BSH [Capsicum annuum]